MIVRENMKKQKEIALLLQNITGYRYLFMCLWNINDRIQK